MDAHAAGDIEIDVVATKADAAMGLEHCEHHRQPAWVPSDDGASRRAERGRRDQRLDFDEKRPRAFDAGEDGRAGLAEIAFREEELRRIGDSRKPEPVISKTPISSVGPKRFFTARRMRN
jgi:hypothetical protein